MSATFNQFVEDMENEGIEVEAYRGRAYWFGPAARASDFLDAQRVIRATTVDLQWDSPLIYPINQDKEWYDDNDAWRDEN